MQGDAGIVECSYVASEVYLHEICIFLLHIPIYHPNIDPFLSWFFHLASGDRTAVLCLKSEAWPWWSWGDPPAWAFEWFWEVPKLYTQSLNNVVPLRQNC